MLLLQVSAVDPARLARNANVEVAVGLGSVSVTGLPAGTMLRIGAVALG